MPAGIFEISVKLLYSVFTHFSDLLLTLIRTQFLNVIFAFFPTLKTKVVLQLQKFLIPLLSLVLLIFINLDHGCSTLTPPNLAKHLTKTKELVSKDEVKVNGNFKIFFFLNIKLDLIGSKS